MRRSVRAPPLRVSMTSGDLGEHAIGVTIPQMLAQIDRRRVIVTLVSTGKEDEPDSDRNNLGGVHGASESGLSWYPPRMPGMPSAADALMESCEMPQDGIDRTARSSALSAAPGSVTQTRRIADLSMDGARRMSQSMRLRRVADAFVRVRSLFARFADDTNDAAFARREWSGRLLLACYHGNRSLVDMPLARRSVAGWSMIPVRLGDKPIPADWSHGMVQDMVLRSHEAA